MVIDMGEKYLVPVPWLRVEGALGTVPTELAACGLFRAMKRGESGEGSEYFKVITDGLGMSPEQARARINKLRGLFESEIWEDFAAPVILHANGVYELRDAHHRVCKMIVDGHTEIPVDLNQVDPMWLAFKDRLERIYSGRRLLYQPIEHPEFRDWEIDRSGRRTELIKDWLVYQEMFSVNEGSAGTAWDLGSCTGHISRMLRGLGFSVIGVEIDDNARAVASYCNWIFDSLVSYRSGDLTNETGVPPHGGGAALTVCVSVLHRFLGQGYHQLVIDRLKRMVQETRVFITDGGAVGDVSLNKSIVSFETEPYMKWLGEVTNREVVHIGQTEKRDVFALAKPGILKK